MRHSAVREILVVAAGLCLTGCQGATSAPVGMEELFVTEANPCGLASPDVAVPNQILDSGSVGSARVTRYEGDRVLFAGDERWILWSRTEHRQLAGAPATPPTDGANLLPFADMRGSLLVIERPGRLFDVRAADDGHVVKTLDLTGATSVGLATDGSYLWAIQPAGLTIWSAQGEVLATRAGSGLTGRVVAVPDRLLRVEGDGAAGPQRIETLEVATGLVTLSGAIPHGTFVSWFSDGSHFLASTGDMTWIYASADAPPVASWKGYFDGGFGDHVWRLDLNQATIEVRALSRGLAVVRTITGIEVADLGEGRLAISADPPVGTEGATLTIVDLRSAGLATTIIRHGGDIAGLDAHPAVAGDGSYVFTGQSGVLWTDSNDRLGCGFITAVAGAADGTLAVATSVGVIMLRVRDDGGADVTGRFNLTGEVLEMSEDGKILAVRASALFGARMVKIVSLETHALVQTWGRDDANGLGGPKLPDPDFVVDFSMARRADRVAISFADQPTFQDPLVFHVYLTNTRGEAPLQITGAGPGLRLSPDGAHLLAQRGNPAVAVKTQLFDETGYIGETAGHASSWWDDGQYVTRLYRHDPSGLDVFDPPTVDTLDGAPIAGVMPPERVDERPASTNFYHPTVVPLPGGKVFSATAGAILDAMTGEVVPTNGIVVAAASRFAIVGVRGQLATTAY